MISVGLDRNRYSMQNVGKYKLSDCLKKLVVMLSINNVLSVEQNWGEVFLKLD